MFRRIPTIAFVATSFASLLATAAALAAPLDLTLNFASLPSSQGFTYVATGAHAGVLESSVFTVGSGMLAQNTIGQYLGTTGAGIYYQRLTGITTTEAKQIRVNARCLQTAGTASFPFGEGGLCFVFTTGSVQYGFTLTAGKVGLLQAGGWSMLPALFDNTTFHDYLFDWAPGGSWQMYRDRAGGANARGDIRSFRFIQDVATAVTPSTWGRVKALYR